MNNFSCIEKRNIQNVKKLILWKIFRELLLIDFFIDGAIDKILDEKYLSKNI